MCFFLERKPTSDSDHSGPHMAIAEPHYKDDGKLRLTKAGSTGMNIRITSGCILANFISRTNELFKLFCLNLTNFQAKIV